VPGLIHRSSNYELYGDLSGRVMSIAAQFAPHVECFLELEQQESDDLAVELFELRQRIRTWTGLPVSIGIGATKTLAKLANDIAKPMPMGIFHWESLEANERDGHLGKIGVGEVWGVGPRLARRLAEIGVHSAGELASADLARIRQHFSVTLARTAAELRGIACLPMVDAVPVRQQIMVSRSFGREITSYESLQESVLTFLARAAEKLRAEGLAAQQLQLFVNSNVFRGTCSIRGRKGSRLTRALKRHARARWRRNRSATCVLSRRHPVQEGEGLVARPGRDSARARLAPR
jgi:DNA polymerase V